MISCVDELGLSALVCILVGDMKGCKVPGKFKFGLTSGCVTKFTLFWGVIEFHIKLDCGEFQFMGVLIPLEFQFIGLFDIVCELSVGDVKNCDCIRLISLYLYVVFLIAEKSGCDIVDLDIERFSSSKLFFSKVAVKSFGCDFTGCGAVLGVNIDCDCNL